MLLEPNATSALALMVIVLTSTAETLVMNRTVQSWATLMMDPAVSTLFTQAIMSLITLYTLCEYSDTTALFHFILSCFFNY